MAQNEPKRQRCVLITRFSALGDVAIALPVVYSVCNENPDVKFVFVTRGRPAQMFINRPSNLTVLGVDLKQYSGLFGIARLANKLFAEYHPDSLADLHGVLRTYMLGMMLQGRGVACKRIDKGRKEKKQLINGKSRQQLTQTSRRYEIVFEQLGLHTKQSFISLQDKNKPLKCSIFNDINRSPDDAKTRWIAIAPFSQHRGKEYPFELMLKVIDTIAKWPDVQLFLFGGGKSEAEKLNSVSNKYNNVKSVTEVEHTFADELALLSKCDIMVSMDSANMHLASLVGVPVVSVWGATHPWCGFMGYNQSEHLTVQHDLKCRPCSVFGNKPCRYNDYHCITKIMPEEIVDRVKSVLYKS